jgi:hypothetical protein
MTRSSMPLLRQAAACLKRAPCTLSWRLAIVVAIVAAMASSAHAAAPPGPDATALAAAPESFAG